MPLSLNSCKFLRKKVKERSINPSFKTQFWSCNHNLPQVSLFCKNLARKKSKLLKKFFSIWCLKIWAGIKTFLWKTYRRPSKSHCLMTLWRPSDRQSIIKKIWKKAYQLMSIRRSQAWCKSIFIRSGKLLSLRNKRILN